MTSTGNEAAHTPVSKTKKQKSFSPIPESSRDQTSTVRKSKDKKRKQSPYMAD